MTDMNPEEKLKQSRLKDQESKERIGDLFNSLAYYAENGHMNGNQQSYFESTRKAWYENNQLPQLMKLDTLDNLQAILNQVRAKTLER